MFDVIMIENDKKHILETFKDLILSIVREIIAFWIFLASKIGSNIAKDSRLENQK